MTDKDGYTESRLSGLRSSAAERRERTVERLRAAIAEIKALGLEVSAPNIFRVSGMQYNVYARNPEAYALFRAESSALRNRQDDAGRQGDVQGTNPPTGTKSGLAARLKDSQRRYRELQDRREKDALERRALEEQMADLLEEQTALQVKLHQLEAKEKRKQGQPDVAGLAEEMAAMRQMLEQLTSASRQFPPVSLN